MSEGVGWIVPGTGTKPLTGFAHGAAGIAWALLTLYSHDPRPEYKRLALQAISYENAHYSDDHDNWPDFRPDSSGWGRSWCHGAPGIGLARIECLKILEEPILRRDALRALQATKNAFLLENNSLCHGNLGNLETIMAAEAWIQKEDVILSTCLDQVARNVANDIRHNEPRCGNPLGVETIGLMTGLSGIGLGLLHVGERKLIPSVLLLQKPSFISCSNERSAHKPQDLLGHYS